MAGPFTFEVTVKYVRREIRALTDQDREMFFNAVSVLQRVPSSVGQQLYGENYYSKDYFNRLHLYYGEWGLSLNCEGRLGVVSQADSSEASSGLPKGCFLTGDAGLFAAQPRSPPCQQCVFESFPQRIMR